jgi:hypothetical protein
MADVGFVFGSYRNHVWCVAVGLAVARVYSLRYNACTCRKDDNNTSDTSNRRLPARVADAKEPVIPV